jgi:prepilin-type N-terminal cleavage/methylation domain-containing protein
MTIIRRGRRATKRRAPAAFTLIEIMVVMILLSVIVLGLMAMFNQTQRAFRAGMAQTDLFEGGRMSTDLILRDIQQIAPTHQSNGLNFYAQIPAYTPLVQKLPASTIVRTDLVQNLFFTSRYNQTWSGIGYYVRTNPDFYGNLGPVGSLYRFETNIPISQMAGTNSLIPYFAFLNTTNQLQISKILDGVVEFRVHCYDLNGLLMTNGLPSISSNTSWTITNAATFGLASIPQDEVLFYGFSNNIVPAFVEVQIGVLEPAILKRYKSIPDPLSASNYLANHAGNVQLFRQRIAIRNVDPSAYNP